MAYIYGKSGHATVTRADRRKDLLLRMGLPLAFLVVLASVGAYAFLHGHYLITTLFIIAFVTGLLRFDELGLTFVHHLSQAETSARSDQVVVKMLRLLPNEYHVFHDLRFYRMRIDHAVVGPNGFFLIDVKRHLGAVTLSKESLRLNGWPFLRDLFGQSWTKAQALAKHLGVQLTAGIELTPVLCFSRGHVGFTKIVRGARVVQATSLVPTILAHEASIPAERLARLTEKLSELVWVKSESIEYTQADIGSPQQDSAAVIGRVCPKCRHRAGAMEMEFFPDECPRCGRFYAADSTEPQSTAPLAVKTVWRPTIPQLVISVLAIAGTAGFFVYWTGVFSPVPAVHETLHTPDGNTTATADQATLESPQTGNVSSPTSEPVQEVKPESINQTDPAQSERPIFTQNPSTTPVPDGNATAESSTATQVNATATVPGNATEGNATAAAMTNATRTNATADATTNATRAKNKQESSSLAETSPTGTLTITASKPVTVWFRDQHTSHRLGPFSIGGKTTKTIVLPKGLYDVLYVENGINKRTSISFLSDKGYLNF